MALVQIGNFRFETTDSNAQAVVDRVLADAKAEGTAQVSAEKARADAAHAAQLESDRKASELQAKHDALKAQVDADKAALVTEQKKRDDGFTAAVAARVSLLLGAQAHLDAEDLKKLGKDHVDQLADDELRKAVILKLQPTAKLDGVDANYLRVRFDVEVEAAKEKKPVTEPTASDVARALAAGQGKGGAPRIDDAPKNPQEAARKFAKQRESESWGHQK